MKRQFILFVYLMIGLLGQAGWAHTFKIPMIIDSDMAHDDARAIVLLLNQDHNDIRLMVSSDGAVSPEIGYQNLLHLIRLMKRDDIPVERGRELGKKPPRWRSWSEQILSTGVDNRSVSAIRPMGAAEKIIQILQSSQDRILYICLGPLTNLADALAKKPHIKNRISKILFFGNRPSSPEPGWNTQRDLASARAVFRSGIPMICFDTSSIQYPLFNRKLLNRISQIDSSASKGFQQLFKRPRIRKLLEEKHFRIWDEMIPIFLAEMEPFQFSGSAMVKTLQSIDSEGVYKLYLRGLGNAADSHLHRRTVVVLRDFPMKSDQYQKDLSGKVSAIIERYGQEEWKACVLTNELHRHLGIYSIVGAKMGIRARELLEAPLDSLRVISFAGDKPPISCMNDGLQVATGASLGRGTIQVEKESNSPAALFSYKQKQLRLTLKKEIVERIRGDIAEGIQKHGKLSRAYFQYVRKIAIGYWTKLDRKEIFDILQN